jgi:hypothetical protein
MDQFYVALINLILPYAIIKWPTGSGGHIPRRSNTGAAIVRPLKYKNIQKIVCQLSRTTRRTAGLKWTTEFKVTECDVSKTGCRKNRSLTAVKSRVFFLICHVSSQHCKYLLVKAVNTSEHSQLISECWLHVWTHTRRLRLDKLKCIFRKWAEGIVLKRDHWAQIQGVGD